MATQKVLGLRETLPVSRQPRSQTTTSYSTQHLASFISNFNRDFVTIGEQIIDIREGSDELKTEVEEYKRDHNERLDTLEQQMAYVLESLRDMQESMSKSLSSMKFQPSKLLSKEDIMSAELTADKMLESAGVKSVNVFDLSDDADNTDNTDNTNNNNTDNTDNTDNTETSYENINTPDNLVDEPEFDDTQMMAMLNELDLDEQVEVTQPKVTKDPKPKKSRKTRKQRKK